MKVPIDFIRIPTNRQRKEFSERDLTLLSESISKRGLINPITIHVDGELIAGERRLRVIKELRWPEVEVRIFEKLDPKDREIIQLEENVRRKDLTWQEEATSFLKIHRLLKDQSSGWTQAMSADYLGITTKQLEPHIRVGVYLESDPTKISHCMTLTAADNIIYRLRDRAIEKETAKISDPLSATLDSLFKHEDIPETTVSAEIKKPAIKKVDDDIVKADFLTWAGSYSGPPFNFLHCDFPYGVNIQSSDQMQSQSWDSYNDTPEIFWSLTTALFANRKRLIAPSAHVMFWFSMTYYNQLCHFLDDFEDLSYNPFPIIWMKSDGSGVLPDPKRGPRRIYETALIISRGDRFIVKPVSNAYAAPLGKKVHLSEKPQPVLRHFFQMFLDETSTVLDPSCGCGNALAVAEEFKVKSVFGLDVDTNSVELARGILRKGRVYEKLGKVEL